METSLLVFAQRVKKELDIARKIQSRLIPADPELPEWRVKGICRPAGEIGGDYLDYFPNQFGDWFLVIADACNKGIPAALTMNGFRATMRAEGWKQSSPKKLLAAANALMEADLNQDHSFITCLCIMLSDHGRALSFARAGHPSPIRIGVGCAPQVLKSRGIAIGLQTGSKFEEMLEEVTLCPRNGDKFFAYTDGLEDILNIESGACRNPIVSFLSRNRFMRPNEISENLLSYIDSPLNGEQNPDDLTFFAIERRPDESGDGKK